MKKRQIIILTSLFSAVVLIIAALSTRGNDNVKKEEQKTKSFKYVKTQVASVTSHALVVKGNGRVGSSRNIVLVSEVQGKLLRGEVNLKPGSHFRKGQLLCKIDDTEAGLKMQARKSGFLTMLATAIPDLKIDYPESFERWETFFESIEVTEDLADLPEIKSVKEKTYLASRNILGEYYSIKADEELLSKYQVIAPFDGNIMDVFTNFGSVVNPGSQIARVIQIGSLEVEVPVQVAEARFLKVGDKVDVYSEGKATKFNGEIIRMGRYVNPNTQSLDVFVSLDANAAEHIYNGMYVQVEVNAGNIENVVRVPRRALIGKAQIYTVSDSILVRRDVEVSFKDEDFAFISGIKGGEDVVIEPIANPVDSMIVRKMTSDD